ncbi:uncharacterized protein LACBIDRAFT_330679 [Laccaria bicolor S238N-H82]|uniref:Predicted protein n=1 Tax=Laccaria bicolor (strain S238N-H82 / ATCC MYA-4686) TaxID=486041 RepID=B0DM40_LACBS|nr:uncharacterized protein LACBIDRAFT_330679 [Laccaria bicolor S238N-H82]EDR04405.1 predicted protein [Laccaria bicolor S238N-H82]|eukprot:XP_001884924.1 predicted protein [Laccaria bicolor S238N-H82]
MAQHQNILPNLPSDDGMQSTKQAMEVDVDSITQSLTFDKSIFNFQTSAISAKARDINFDWSLFDFTKPTVSSPSPQSIFDFQKPGISSPSSGIMPTFDQPKLSSPTNEVTFDRAIFNFDKPKVSSLAKDLSIFDFQKPGMSSPASGSHFSFEFHKPDVVISDVDKSVFSFQPSTPVSSSQKPARGNPGSRSKHNRHRANPSLQPPNEPEESLGPIESTRAIIPTAFGQAMAYAPYPIFIHTHRRLGPRPPRSTKLVELDSNSRLWERVTDPDPSPDPVLQDMQAKLDQHDSQELTHDDAMDSLSGRIHQEAVRSLPENITTTSHYRYILTRMRRDKESIGCHLTFTKTVCNE